MYFDQINNYDEENDESFEEESELDEEMDDELNPKSKNINSKIKYNEEEEITDHNQSNDDEVVTDSDNEKKSGNENKDQSEDDSIDINSNSHDNDNYEDILMNDEHSDGVVDKINELLFCVQGIGKYIDEKQTIYEKGKYCEPSLRDIHRFLRKDDPENPECRYNILNWKTAENDIIPLILNYENNEKIQQLGLVILVDITESLPDIVERRQQLEFLLTDLQEFIINSKLIELLSRSLADYTAKLREASIMRRELMLIEKQERDDPKEFDIEEETKANEIKKKIAEVENKSETMIELIFVLLKQIMNIINSESIKSNVKNNITLIRKLSSLKILDAIVFHAQSFETEFYKRLSSTILELLFFLIRPFTAAQIHEIANDFIHNNRQANRPQGQTVLQKLMEEEKQQKLMRQAMISNRPNNFGTMIKINRPMDNTSFIVSNINMLTNNKEKFISNKMNEFANQRKKPRRGMKILKDKKIVSKAAEEIKFVNDIKINQNFSTSIDYTYGEVMVAFKKFCEDFLKNCLNKLIRHFIIELKLNEKIERYDYYHIVLIMTFFLDFNRLNEYKMINIKKEKAEKEKNSFSHIFNGENVKECISAEMIDHCYNIAYAESMNASANERKLFELYSTVRYLKQVLLTGFDLYKYRDDSNLERNVVIQDNLVTKDFSKIIKAIFYLFNEYYHPRKLVYESIQLAEIYFSSLDLYSNKRKLKKKIKKRKIKNDDESEEDYAKKLKQEQDEFIERDKEGDDKEDDDENTGSVSLSDDAQEEFLEKDLNVKEEMKVIIDYTIISRIFYILNPTNSIDPNNILAFLNELKSNDIIKYTTKLFERIYKNLVDSWIFYQMEFLYIIHSLMNEQQFTGDVYFHGILKVFKDILKSFFAEVEKNKMLPIESLFRFPSYIIKDSILNNYDEIQPDIERELNSVERNRNDVIGGYDNNLNQNDEEEEYDGNNIEMVKVVEDAVVKTKKKEKKIESDEEKMDAAVWTEKEDLLLIQNYSEFSELDNFYQMLDQLFPLKNMKEIKARIKLFKLKKGINKAMKVFKKIHKKRKQKEEKLFNIIIELSDECRDENKRRKIEKTILSLRQQLESYKVRKGLMDNSPNLECVLVPNSEDEIETMQDVKFQNFIKNVGLIPPDDDSIHDNNHKTKCWRVDPKSDTYEISILIEKLENFERVINENVEIEDPERAAERRKARKERKERKEKKKHKKHKKDKKEKKKKKKKKEEYEERSDVDDDNKNYNNNKSERRSVMSVHHSVLKSQSEAKTIKSRTEYKQSISRFENKSSIDNITVKNSVVFSSKSKIKENNSVTNQKRDFDCELDLNIYGDEYNNNIQNNNSQRKKKKLRKGLRDDDDFNFD